MGYKDPNDPRADVAKARYYAALKADPERWAEYLRGRAKYAMRLQRDQPEMYRERIRLGNLAQRAKAKGIQDADVNAYAAFRARKNALGRARYQQSPERRQRCREQNARRTRDAQTRLAAIKVAQGCVDCGYSAAPEALHFDHVDYRTKAADISQMKTATPARLAAELAKCVVRCANCHAIRTAQQQRDRWAAKRSSAA